MAKIDTTSSIEALSDQVNTIAAQLAGTEATLRMFRDSSECGPGLNDAIGLLALSVGRMNDELSTIASQMTKGGAA